MDPICRIKLLGGLQVWCRGEPVTRFRSRRTVELLAYLACHLRREHPREVLIELFWPDCDLDAGRHSLNVALSSLRKELEPAGVPAGSVLRTDRFGVRLVSEAVSTDVSAFEAAVRAAAEAPPHGDQRASRLSEALALYGGELLPGHYDDWVVPEQQRLDELHFQALRALMGQLRGQGDFEGALRLALQGARANGLREELHREIIRIYLDAGRVDEAVRHYRELVRRLAQELDLLPSAETRSLIDVLQSENRPEPRPEPPTHPHRAIAVEAALPERGELEPLGGAMPLGSRFYVVRQADVEFDQATGRRDSIILLRGARQVGKTSLLARGLQRARDAGFRVAISHFQGFNAGHLESAEALLLALAEDLVEQLDLDISPAAEWNRNRGPNPNFRRFLRRDVLERLDRPLLWGMDGVDRLFDAPFATDVFGLFRSWHEERALEPGGPWGVLTLTLVYSTEAHLLISDLNQSPFNVGTRVEMYDFTREQVADLNRRYGNPLRSDEDLNRFHGLLNGHPFLVRQGLHALTSRPANLAALEAGIGAGDVFGPHLRRLLMLVEREPPVRAAVLSVLAGGPCPSTDLFYRLRSAGILSGDGPRSSRLRCSLYELFLRENLQ